MRLVYFGTPSDAVPPLLALVAAGHDVALVVTQPDRRRGARGNELLASPVKAAALDLGLTVATPEKSREVVDTVRALDAELGVVVAFGQLLPPALLAATRSGFVNVHFSLLPRWRGAAPVERAILAGDHETGVAIMAMEEGLDTGGVFAEARVPIGAMTTAGALREQLVELGTELLVRELPTIPGRTPRPQEGEPTYAHKLTVDEFRLDASRSSAELHRIVQAGNPKPGAWGIVGGKRLKVWHSMPFPVDHGVGAGVIANVDGRVLLGCSPGALALADVQPEGKPRMAASAWLAGRRGETVLDAAS